MHPGSREVHSFQEAAGAGCPLCHQVRHTVQLYAQDQRLGTPRRSRCAPPHTHTHPAGTSCWRGRLGSQALSYLPFLHQPAWFPCVWFMPSRSPVPGTAQLPTKRGQASLGSGTPLTPAWGSGPGEADVPAKKAECVAENRKRHLSAGS